MPSSANPESPFMDSRLQSVLGVRAPGSPTSAGKPSPQAADLSFPAPPGVNAAPPGRPGGPSVPTPAAAVPSAPTPGATPQPGGGVAAPQPTRPAQSGQAPTQPGQAVAVPGTIGALPRLPTPAELPVTGSVATPLGVVGRDANGQPSLSGMTPEGAQRYRDAVTTTQTALGPLPRIFRHASLPTMPALPGKWNYNPFTGAWSK